MFNWQAIVLVGGMAFLTYCIRLFPFILFKKHTPLWVIYLGQVFPYSIMAILLIYSVKDIRLDSQRPLAAIIAMIVVFILHRWRHSTILSILGGTLTYMILIQAVLV